MSRNSHRERLLALDVHRLSFGFAVLEGPIDLVDWGVKSFRHGTNAVRVPLPQKVARLIEEFRPDTIALRIAFGVDPRQTRAISSLTKTKRITIRTISHQNVLQTFPGHNRKYEIALSLASRFPELANTVPPKPKPWQNEYYRTSIFEAIAAGLTYFATGKNNRDSSRVKCFRRPLIDA